MRHEPNLRIEEYRFCPPGWESPSGVNYGVFRVWYHGVTLHVISSGTDELTGWEHVSVSVQGRTPTWAEMQHVKELFWRDDECVLQFHPPADRYVNNHPHCLHMWRQVDKVVELPPVELVGVPGVVRAMQ